MKILVIGKNSNLGRELMPLLGDHEVVGTSSAELNIADESKVKEFISVLKPQLVFNCAAYTAVDKAETDYETAELINGYAAGFIAKACSDVEAILVHFSTGMVFAGDDQNGYNEDSTTNPVNAYGKSKLLGEEQVAKLCSESYIIRTEWLYSKPENENSKKSFNEIILELAASGQPLKGVEDEIGQPTWAKDLAKKSIEIVEQKLPYGIYHIANSGRASRLEWAKEILRLNNLDLKIEPVSGKSFPRPALRPNFELLNNNNLPQMRSWQEALAEYFQKS